MSCSFVPWFEFYDNGLISIISGTLTEMDYEEAQQ